MQCCGIFSRQFSSSLLYVWFVQNVRQLFYVMLGNQNKKRKGKRCFALPHNPYKQKPHLLALYVLFMFSSFLSYWTIIRPYFQTQIFFSLLCSCFIWDRTRKEGFVQKLIGYKLTCFESNTCATIAASAKRLANQRSESEPFFLPIFCFSG